MTPDQTEHGKVALEFAKALVAGEYLLAKEMISLNEEVDLKAEYLDMIEYGDGPVTHVEVMNEMDAWPTKKPNDVGWAYVAIAGSNYSEAVAVVVSGIEGALKITEIEWGRP